MERVDEKESEAAQWTADREVEGRCSDAQPGKRQCVMLDRLREAKRLNGERA
jgi:hypothetical protein